jgi:solute carrier family 25 (mitochondrial phosphate transporter), member 23/24/25/41
MDEKSCEDALNGLPKTAFTLGEFLLFAHQRQKKRATVVRESKKKKKSGPAPWTSAVAGGIGNAFSRTAVAPLERTRMQMIVDPGKYGSMFDCLRVIFKEEGAAGYWRGNGINVMRIAPQGAIAFYAKSYFKTKMAGKGNKPTKGQVAISSMLSGICCQTLVYPLDIIRTRLTTAPGLYKGSWIDLQTGVADGFRTIIREEGPRALFKGLYPANVFAVPYYGSMFFVYDAVLASTYKTYGLNPGEKERKMNPFVAIPFGSISSMFACFVAFPFQMVWKRIQTQGVAGRPVLYKGPVDCMVKVVKTEGAKGVYSGLRANLMKLAPTGALTFMAVESVKDIMGWR